MEEEIIEKIRTEYELNTERVFTDALFNSAPGMIYLYNDKSKLVRWNKKHEEMTGYSTQELASMKLLDWFAGDEKSQTAIMEGIKSVTKNGFGDAEATLQKKDGTKIPMYFTASPITIEGKQYFAGIGIDITDRERMHERLEKYRVLAEKANDAMLFIDTAGNILEVNDAAIRIYGYTFQEFSSMNIFENEGMRGNTINTIINTLHEKNLREELHSKRVSQICKDIGRAIGLSEMEVNRLKVVGLLHDIGKIAIEEGILNKLGKLTENEWEQIKSHPDIGYRILSSSHEMVDLADCILAHHERWDGTDYPNGLKGEAIPLVSRIIALADSYDAMISERPYRNALSEEQALKEIQKNSGTQFDPEIARIFILSHSRKIH